MCGLIYQSMCYLFILGIIITAQVRGELRLIDNGYEDLIIEIEDTVSENMCSSVFQGIEESLTRGSSVLYRATQQRAFFRDVTVIVPQSWSGSHCPSLITSGTPPTMEASISVGAPHPVYMHTPWTLQEKGCGKPGKKIFVTAEFLAMRNHSTSLGDPGRILVHEWAKYRWGVFEEYGHEGDPVYPSYQRVDTHTFTPTGCSNIRVEGIPESCNPQDKKCHFVPSLSQNDGVTSSLMYLHYLPRVTQFCDSHTHSTHAQTKHNVLCGRRSVWDVMRDHEDFLNSSVPGEITRDVAPTFTYVKPVARRYVIVIEDTTVMNVQKRWDFLRKAIRKLLVYDLPAGHEVGVVLFDEDSSVKLPLTPTPSALEKRQRLATASLPRNPSRVAPSQKCILCGLQEAVNMLQEGSEKSSAGGVIILISSGTPVPLSKYDSGKLEQEVRRGKIQLVPIMYPVTTRNPQPTPGVEHLAEISGTRSFAVLDEGIGSDSKVSMMVSLMNSLYSSLRLFLPSPKQLPLLVHQQEFPGGISSTSQGSFDLDESLGGEVRFCLTYYDLGHVGNTINLIDPQGNVLDSYNLQEEDGDVNMIFVTIRNAMPGRWSYKIENRADSHQSLFIQVLSTPSERKAAPVSASSGSFAQSQKAFPAEAVVLEAWTSSKTTLLNVSDSASSIAIYAKLWAGRSPVVGARVEAILQRLGFNSTGSHFRPIRFRLFDSGNGDADLTKNDGVYSRHLPALDDTPAKYTLTVVADDDNGKAAIVAPAIPEPHAWPIHSDLYISRNKRALAYGMSGPNCCGSVVQYSRTIDAGFLSRSVSVGILDLVGEHASLGIVPPSRVGDLRVTVNYAALHASFSWSAPGDQKDHGRASRYEVVFSRDSVATSMGSGERIEQWPTPLISGSPSQHTIRWNRHDGVYYVSLRAISRSGHPGPWSNIVSVYVPPPATTTEINTRGSTFAGATGETIGELSPPARSRSLLSNKDILAIIGAGCGIFLIILVLIIYYMVVVSRRRQDKEKKVKEVIETNSVTPAAPEPEDETDSINKQPPDTLNINETPTGIQRPLSPIQSWPASKLLAEHERRRSADPSYGETPDLGVPYQPPPFYYHTPNGNYIEDTIPIDSGSMVSSQPSESMLVYKLDTSAGDSVHPPSTSPLGSTPVSWEGQTPTIKRSKIPPPTLPKPSITPSFDVCSSSATLGHERRRRNVTQV